MINAESNKIKARKELRNLPPYLKSAIFVFQQEDISFGQAHLSFCPKESERCHAVISIILANRCYWLGLRLWLWNWPNVIVWYLLGGRLFFLLVIYKRIVYF